MDQLRSPETSEDSSVISDDESDEAVEEDIDIEEEIDEGDPVLARNDEESGIVLLEQQYLVKPIMLSQAVNLKGFSGLENSTKYQNRKDGQDYDHRTIGSVNMIVDYKENS